MCGRWNNVKDHILMFVVVCCCCSSSSSSSFYLHVWYINTYVYRCESTARMLKTLQFWTHWISNCTMITLLCSKYTFRQICLYIHLYLHHFMEEHFYMNTINIQRTAKNEHTYIHIHIHIHIHTERRSI